MRAMGTEPSQVAGNLTERKAEFLRQLAGMSTDEKLTYLCLTLWELTETFDEFRPLLDRYKRAANANGMFQARRELRKG